MNTYLNIDEALPSDIAYLNIANAEIPPVLFDFGGITNLFRFNLSNNDFIGNATTVGKVEQTQDGYLLGKSGYIDTGLKESEEFTWFVLARTSSGSNNTPLVSSLTRSALSPTGFSAGNHLGKQSVTLKVGDASSSTSAFSSQIGGQVVGNWVLMALSRKNRPTTAFDYNFACKPQGVVMRIGSQGGNATQNTVSNITIGAAPDSDYAPTVDTLFNFVSIHNKGMTPAELSETMNDLVTVFAKQGIML
ncbi:MAG TPA: hypothetical protein PLH48_05435 [Acinetobacter johnsonii]|nr:hypothetical protein [Acinetobacter johnsonii]